MDESNIPVIADAKSEYITQLTRVLTPHIFEGIISIFKDAKNIVLESKEEDKILKEIDKITEPEITYGFKWI